MRAKRERQSALSICVELLEAVKVNAGAAELPICSRTHNYSSSARLLILIVTNIGCIMYLKGMNGTISDA